MSGPNEAWCKLPAVALLLGISRQRVHQLVKEKRLPTHEHNGHLFVHFRDVESFKNKKRQADGSFRYS